MLFLLTLPWQMRQWKEAARLEEEAALRESRVRKLEQERRQSGSAASSSAMSAGGISSGSVSARVQTVADRVQRAMLGGGGPAVIAEAAADIKRLEADAARSAPVADILADLYQQIGYWDKAMEMARLSRRLAPGTPGPLMRLGYLETALGHPKAGMAYFRQAAERAPRSAAEPHVALALAHAQNGDLKAAEQELRAARRLQSDNWHTALLLAQNLTARRRFDEAETAFAEVLRLAPEEPQPYIEQAAFLLERAEDRARDAGGGAARSDIASARRAAERALVLEPGSASAHFQLGRIHAKLGDEKDALREWEQVLAVSPSYPKLRVNLGQLLIRTGERERGQKLLREAARDAEESAEFNRLVIRSGNAPDNVELRRDLARWCREHGRLSRAILEWQEILARRPGDPEARQQLQAALARRDGSS